MMNIRTKITLPLSILVLCVSLFIPRPTPINSQTPLDFELIQTLGRGTISTGAWSSDGEILALGGSQGIWLYGEMLTDIGLIAGHPPKIQMIAWSPDNSKIASVSGNNPNEIIIWDLQTHTQIARLTGPSARINSMMWNPLGNYLASGSEDSSIRVWDTSNWQVHVLTAHTASVSKALWSPDGQNLASSSLDNTIRIWDTTTWQSQTLSGHTETISEIAWSPDSQKIASSSWDTTVRIWNIVDGQAVVLSGHQGRVLTVAWSPDGSIVASGNSDSHVFIWDSSSHALITQLPQTGGASQILWYPDGSRLLSANRAKIIWDIGSQQAIYTLDDGADAAVDRLIWRKHHKQFISISSGTILQLWDADTGQVLNTIAAHTGFVASVAWGSDASQIGGIDPDGWVRTWQVESGDLAIGFPANINVETGIAAWNSTWSYLAADVMPNGKLRIFDWQASVATSPEISVVASLEYGEYGFLTDVAWSPDDSRLASITMLPSRGVRIFDTNTWELASVLNNSRIDHTETLKWNPASGLLAVGGEDSGDYRQGIVQIWDINTATPQASFQVGATSVVDLAWNPDGTQLAIISEDRGVFYGWDSSTATLTPYTLDADELMVSLAWSSENLLAIAGEYKLHLWDMSSPTPHEIAVIESPDSRINDIQWRPDGKFIASGDSSGTIHIWEHIQD